MFCKTEKIYLAKNYQILTVAYFTQFTITFVLNSYAKDFSKGVEKFKCQNYSN
jgi:hypothetical protein